MKWLDEKINLITAHISMLLERLSTDEGLNEKDCMQLISDLKELQVSYIGKEENQSIMETNIEDLLVEFNDRAASSKTLLEKMLAVIVAGCVPDTNDVKVLDGLIEDLRQKYNSIYSLAMVQVSEKEMPDVGLSAQEYVEAVRNSVVMQFKKQLDAARKILEDFIAVKSTVVNYMSALAPYQDEARSLLSDIGNNVNQDTETLEKNIAGPRAFLEALECDDIDSDEGMNLVDKVNQFYPSRVGNGLAAGKYFISKEEPAEDVASVEKIVTEQTTTEKATTEKDATERVAVEQTTVEQDAAEEVTVERVDAEEAAAEKAVAEQAVAEEIATGESVVENVGGTEPEEDSEFVKSVRASGLLITATDHVGKLTCEKYSSEDKKITASVFQNDIRKGNEKVLKAILRELCIGNSISVRRLDMMKSIPENLAITGLDYLNRKGYIRKYSVTPGGDYYCASPKFIKAVSFKEAAKTIGVRQRPVGEWGTPIEDKGTSALSRVVNNRLYCDSVQRFSDKDIDTFSDNTCTFTDAFISKTYPSDRSIPCDLNIGVFWDNTEECDSFIEHLKKTVAEEDHFGYVIFATVNFAKAKILADIVMETVGNISADGIYLYSATDESQYAYPNQENVDILVNAEADDNNDVLSVEDLDAPIQDVRSNKEAEVVLQRENSLTKTPNSVPTQVIEKSAENVESIKIGPTCEETVVEQAISLINAGKLYATTAFTKAYATTHPEYTQFYNQLAYAVNDPMGHCNYATGTVFSLIENRGQFEEALSISTAIRTFFSNQVRFDYNIKSFYDGIKGYKLLRDYPSLSKVVYTLMEFKNSQKKGMDAYADYRSRSKAELSLKLERLQHEARIFYENFVTGRKKENASQKRFLETKKLMFSVDSAFGIYLKAIVDGEADMQSLAMEFLQKHFYKEDSIIAEDTIDTDKLWDYITYFWEKAGDSMMYRTHADLMSHLRNNIISTTTKAVQILAKWCDLVGRISESEDDGDNAYVKVRQTLIDNIKTALVELRKTSDEDSTSEIEHAGLEVLNYTLNEILGCINGTFIEESRKYFYVPFLLTDDLMLNEEYIPDLKMHSSTLNELSPIYRILEHVQKAQKGLPKYDARLKEILDDKGDDYGQARLIVNYLMETDSSSEWNVFSETIENGEVYAKETADLRKEDFIGDLELAQSYGQIDNSNEDKKEKILQIIDEWYKWAVETSNYGFFKRVMDSYLAEIKEEAKIREKDLLEQLESFKSAPVSGLSVDEKEKRVARIQRMIQEQNYTVAEDILARANTSEEDSEEMMEDDFLEDFLDNYDDYYQPVAKSNTSFANLVSSRTRNKEERGAKRLADNWLPGGSLLGQDRLFNLLTCMGFKVDSIKPQNPIRKFEHFSVKTIRAQGGQRDNYTHPIAAFGSGAAQDGFRVVCINGAYDADGLINVMKEIGNAKHTLILLDYALTKSERRRLARKSKNSLGDKLFGVVDRTVMMFLVRNFDETKINRMLISIITPFGYYQPYVWESANVMPPEIFMGRKRELERIKSATGVNIVYGGRQLGKSALLKKAKDDIDYDESGNRAVLIDIKGLDYKKAANKIGHELYDASVLEEDINTEDWNELARTIKRRLQSDKNRIPYLLLLLDEADAFIDSCSAENYQPFDALKDIQSIGVGRFKFVIAGLRNIVRFKREALGNNSVLTHLQAMTVKPFTTSEARELMEVPLYYLGLRFPKEKEYLVTLILATTNYFPGLIQMYCAKLINAMRNKDYANYDEVDTPIYEVSEEHIKKVLADPEFMQQIREKYMITLKLDEDNYYYLIALLMAYLYHCNGYSEGYSAEDIKNAGNELEISKISNLELNKLESFMEELKELNVLRNTSENQYLFTRFTFFQMMGTRAEVDDKLVEYMGE